MVSRPPLLVFLVFSALGVTPAGCGKGSEPGPAPLVAKNRLTLDANAELEAAREAVAAGRPNDAIGRLWPVVQEQPDQREARVVLASAYALVGRHAEALAEADAVLAVEPTSLGALLTRSTALIGLNRYREAIAVARAVLAAVPDHPAALVDLATAAEAAEDWSDHDEARSRLIALQPDRVALHVDLARSLMRRGKHADAERVLREGIVRVPRHADLQLLLAAVLYEQGRLEEAMDRADIAARIAPDRALAVELFRASFYVAVARTLVCRYGPAPWSREAVETVLKELRSQGLEGADAFYEIHASYGQQPDVQARIARAAEGCGGGPGAVDAGPTPDGGADGGAADGGAE